jgi:hypothetical protein
MSTLLFLAKAAGLLIAGSLLVIALGIAAVRIRKSSLFIFRSDLRALIVEVMHDTDRATLLCGAHADLIMGPRLPPPGSWPAFRDPEVSLQSWLPLLPLRGEVDARIAGAGGVHSARGSGNDQISKISDATCEGTVRLEYRFQWEDNGRSVNLRGEMIGTPTIVKVR